MAWLDNVTMGGEVGKRTMGVGVGRLTYQIFGLLYRKGDCLRCGCCTV